MTLPVLFVVPARGGSRRIADKNLQLVAGIPLVAHAVRTARAAAALVPGGPHAVVVSTDDPRIADTARAWHAEVPFMRPAALATDTASSVDVVLHVLDQLAAAGRRYRTVALVQPTSPMTDPHRLEEAVALVDGTDARSAIGVVRSHPGSWHLGRDDRRVLGPDGPTEHPARVDDVWLPTGGVYAIEPELLRSARRFLVPGATIGVDIPAEQAVDVDEVVDLLVANALATARPATDVPLGDRVIGDGRPVFVIAEAGVNHDGSVDIAHRLVDAAAEAGADAVKFQTFDPEALASAGTPLAAYQARRVDAADQRTMLAALALPADAWPGLQQHAADRGIVFLSSPFDGASADLLDRLEVAAFKVASGELTNHPFLADLARRGRPMLVSTGMADMREVADALDVVRDHGDPPVALFHCVSSYPADPADANLNVIATMRAAFRRPTGWSDHSPGIELPTAAVGLGAALIEKHLTLDRSASGPDHAASLEPSEFGAMVTAIRSVGRALGDGVKRPTDGERSVAAVARRSLHWRRALPAGSVVEPGDLIALRPGTGIPPSEQASIVGRRTSHAVREGRPLESTDLEAGT